MAVVAVGMVVPAVGMEVVAVGMVVVVMTSTHGVFTDVSIQVEGS